MLFNSVSCASGKVPARMAALIAAFIVTACAGAPSAALRDASAPLHAGAQKIAFKSDGLVLEGFLYKPDGDGPFPALIWNHGSEHYPDAGTQFDSVASIFVPAGYVVFAPVRRGHGQSQGPYIIDDIHFARFRGGRSDAAYTAVRLLFTQQLADQLAGLAYVKQLSFVDAQRIAVAGCSFGGIETLLGAASGAGYKAAISLSPGAQSWDANPYLGDRLIEVVRKIGVPTLLLQPARDASLAPSYVLGKAAAQAGIPLTAKVYPRTGPRDEQKHCFGGAKGMHVWAEDAKAFLASQLH